MKNLEKLELVESVKTRSLSDKRFLTKVAFLSLLFLFYGNNEALDCILGVLFVIIAFSIQPMEQFVCLYFVLMCFENILVLPFIGGSLFVVYELLLVLKLCMQRKRMLIKNYPILTCVCVALLYVSIACGSTFKGLISTLINCAMLIIILPYIRKNYRYAFATLAIAAIGSGFYGVVNQMTDSYGTFNRFSGAIGDPNYSCYLYTVGIFAAFSCDMFKRNEKHVVFGALCLLTVLSVSLSGVFFLIMLLMIYLFFKNANKAFLYVVAVMAALMLFIMLPIESGPLLGIHTRIHRVLAFLAEGNLNAVSSNRGAIGENYLNYFWTLPMGNLLFGGRNILAGNERDKMVEMFKTVSHNSYIDCLYLLGIIGTVVLCAAMVQNVVKEIKRYKAHRDLCALSLGMIKITALLYMLVISIFPYRFWYGIVFI